MIEGKRERLRRKIALQALLVLIKNADDNGQNGASSNAFYREERVATAVRYADLMLMEFDRDPESRAPGMRK